MSYQPRYEVFPETRQLRGVKYPTGQFVWHFQDANGRITFIGGESFTRREDAHRSIEGVFCDMLALNFGISGESMRGSYEEHGGHLPIVDLDENGEVLGS